MAQLLIRSLDIADATEIQNGMCKNRVEGYVAGEKRN